MATMELNEREVALVMRARQTPAEREAANAAQRAEHEAFMLARMTDTEKAAYLKRKAAVEAMTPAQRVTERFLWQKAAADVQLAQPTIAAEVDAVMVIVDGYKPKPPLQAKPDNLLRAPAKKGR